jgi:hypothetical protein
MARTLDPVERQYEQALAAAQTEDEAYELVIGLRQYRELYQPRSDAEGEQ